MNRSEIDQKFLDEITESRYPRMADERPPLRIDIAGVGQPTPPEDVGPAPDDDLAAMATQMAAGTQAAESPALTPPTDGAPSITAYDPTTRERLAEFLQAGFESVGMERFQARRQAQSLVGGPSSNLPLQLGVADIVPFLGTGLQTEEAGKMLGEAADLAQQGDFGGAAINATIGALGLIPGAVGTVQVARKVGGDILQEMATTPPRGSVQIRPTPVQTTAFPKYFAETPKTSKEIDRLTDALEKQAKDSGFRVKAGASNVSGSRYVTITKDLPDDEVYSVQVRISNHGDKYPGSLDVADKRFLIDPDTGNTLQDALQFLEDEGFVIKKTKKREKSLTDSELAKKYGIDSPVKLTNKKVGSAFDQMVREARQDFEEVMSNWEGGVFLNDDADKLITYPGRDQAFSRGKEGGKVVVNKKDMINWLMSEGPFDKAQYGPDIKNDKEYVNQIERLRSIIREAK